MAIEGGAAELAADHARLGFEDVDQGRRRAGGQLAPERDGRGEDRRGHGLELAAVLPDRGQQALEPGLPVRTPPRPERARGEAPLPPLGRAIGAGGQLGDAGGALPAGQGLDVELADDGVAEEGDLAAAGLGIVGGAAHAPRVPRRAPARNIQRRGEAGPGEPGQPADPEELADEEPAEGAGVGRRLRLRPVQVRQGCQDLGGLEHPTRPLGRPRARRSGHGPRQQRRHGAARGDARHTREERARRGQRGDPADPAPDRDPRALERRGHGHVGRRGIEEVDQRGRLGHVGLQAAVRVEPGRPERPGAPARAPGTPHPLQRQPLRRALGLSLHQERDPDQAPPVEPDPGALAEHAVRRSRRPPPAGPDCRHIPLEVGPCQRDAHEAFLHAAAKRVEDAQTPRVWQAPGASPCLEEPSLSRQRLKDYAGRNGQITATQRARLHAEKASRPRADTPRTARPTAWSHARRSRSRYGRVSPPWRIGTCGRPASTRDAARSGSSSA